MLSLISSSLFIFFLATFSIPSIFLLLEVLAAVFPRKKRTLPVEAVNSKGKEIQIAVLIPAHDEADVIGRTLDCVIGQLHTRDRLLVVADNCTDATASIAREKKAEVVVRHDDQRRGKGYALDCGIQTLKRNSPDVVVILDADIQLAPGTLRKIAMLAFLLNRPVQAKNLLTPSPAADSTSLISAFAFLLKNHVRPLGLAQLGGGCLLTGTGMAFAWNGLTKVGLASGNLVEDMQFGIDLAIAGQLPLYCRDGLVTSEMPPNPTAALQQRTRWEHGHYATLLSQTLRLLKAALRQRRFDLFLLGMELLVPPLASFALLLGTVFAASLVATFSGLISVGFVFWSGGLIALLAFTILTGWLFFGRGILSAKQVLAIPLYILWKVPIYSRLLFQRERKWIRTERR